MAFSVVGEGRIMGRREHEQGIERRILVPKYVILLFHENTHIRAIATSSASLLWKHVFASQPFGGVVDPKILHNFHRLDMIDGLLLLLARLSFLLTIIRRMGWHPLFELFILAATEFQQVLSLSSEIWQKFSRKKEG